MPCGKRRATDRMPPCRNFRLTWLATYRILGDMFEETAVGQLRGLMRPRFTARAIADMCGVHDSTIYRWYRGESCPSPASLARLEAALRRKGLGYSSLDDLLAPPKFTPLSLAEQLGVSHCAVWKWLNGHSKPSGELRRRLEAVTGIPADLWRESPRARLEVA